VTATERRPPVLIVPGWTGSGPDHWQSRWQRAHPSWRRVEQRDWERPEPRAWDHAIAVAIEASPTPPILVAHSLGCVLVARFAAAVGSPVAGALLVAPADVERPDAPPALRPFAPLPLATLGFPSLLVASDDDPFLDGARARSLADAWGSELVPIGAAGHVNTSAGFGPWPAGLALLDRLMPSVRAARRGHR
jgi:uncharacterized protein